MKTADRHVRTAALTALAGMLLVVAWQGLTVQFLWHGNWTGLFCVGSQLRMPPEMDRGLERVRAPHGYDAAYYRLLAHDPFFKRGFVSYIDDPRLRTRRILIPAAAWGLALGNDGFIDAVYIALIAASVFAGIYWTGLWMTYHGRDARWGALFVLVPATLTSIDRMLLDGPLCAAFAGFAYRIARGTRPWVLLMAAPLIKETGMFFAAGLALTEIRSRQWRAAGLTCVTQLPALAWFGFAAARTPPSQALTTMSSPLIGQLERLFTPLPYPAPLRSQIILQAADTVSIVCLLLSIWLALRLFWPYRDGVGAAVLLFALLGIAASSPFHLTEAYGFARPVSPMLWALSMTAIVRGRWFAAAVPLGLTASVGLVLAAQLAEMIRRF